VPIALDVSFIERKTPPHVEEALANFIKPSSKSRTNCSLAGRKRKNCGLATEIKWTGKLVTHSCPRNLFRGWNIIHPSILWRVRA